MVRASLHPEAGGAQEPGQVVLMARCEDRECRGSGAAVPCAFCEARRYRPLLCCYPETGELVPIERGVSWELIAKGWADLYWRAAGERDAYKLALEEERVE